MRQGASTAAGAALLTIVCSVLLASRHASGVAPGPGAVSTADLAATWQAERLPLPIPPLMRHVDVEHAVRRAVQAGGGLVSAEVAGRSVEGRSIYHVRVGRGPMRVLLWSQMHGDEPTATVVLFDLIEYIRRHQAEPHVERLLESLSLHMVPMLNPDGAERYQRRNAQGIDINRDALMLQSPEGRLLKSLRDTLRPALGFNLHNQNWRTSIGKPPRPAAMSLLAVASDEARSEHAGRRLAKQVCAVIREAVEPLLPGMIGRYDDEFEVRAFGDNLTRWGTPVVLVETGPYPSRQPDVPLMQANFVALVAALDALASGRVRDVSPAAYETLPLNGSALLFTLVRHASVVNGRGAPPFIADIGIAGARRVERRQGRREVGWSFRIEDLGDLRTYGALEVIDATGLVAAPLVNTATREGDRVDLPIASARGPFLEPGQPAALMLLRPDGARYVVTHVLRRE